MAEREGHEGATEADEPEPAPEQPSASAQGDGDPGEVESTTE